jgi:hypothetical protein
MHHASYRATFALAALALVLARPHVAQAQAQAAPKAAPKAAVKPEPMPEVGTISGGNRVLLERRTVKTVGKETTATLRTLFTKPAKAPGGDWYGSRTVVAVRCTEGTVAVKENRYYADANFTKVANEKIVQIPGYAAPVPGSVPALALKALCPPA